MDMKQIRDDAREKMKPHCRVCPVCNGKACAGEVPGMGGIGTGESFMENVRALAEWKLNLRTLHDAAPFDTTLDLWGQTLTTPIMAAPLAGLAAHFEKKLSELPLESFTVTDIHTYAKTVCEKASSQEDKNHKEKITATVAKRGI